MGEFVHLFVFFMYYLLVSGTMLDDWLVMSLLNINLNSTLSNLSLKSGHFGGLLKLMYKTNKHSYEINTR